MVLVFLVMYPPTWTRIYTRIHAHARKFIRLYAFTLWNNSLEFVPFPIYPPPPSTPSLCQFLFHFFHCSLPDASHANGTVFAWSIIIIFFFPPVFLSLYTDFSFLSYSPTSTIIPTLPQFSSSSSRLISSRSYISPRVILFFVFSFFFFLFQSMVKNVSWNIWCGLNHFLY